MLATTGAVVLALEWNGSPANAAVRSFGYHADEHTWPVGVTLVSALGGRGCGLGDIGTSRRAARWLTFGNVGLAGYPEHAAVAFSTGSADLVVREVAASPKEDTQHT
jgi:hypothetical protein